jgi:integrase
LQQQYRRDREDNLQQRGQYTIATWMATHFAACADEQSAKDSTIEIYEQKERLYITPYLGDIPLEELDTPRIRLWYARELKRSDGQRLAFTTRKNTFALLSAALERAVTERLIRFNPCDGVKIIRPEGEDEHRGYAMSATEAERLLTITEGRWLYGLIYTAIATGMRESELIGLRWNNVILTDTHVELRVVEQYKVVRGQGR